MRRENWDERIWNADEILAQGKGTERKAFLPSFCSLRLGTFFQPAKRIFETLLARLVPLPLVRFVAPGAIDFLL